MTTGLISVLSNTMVKELRNIFDRRKIHHILVEDEKGELQGIISTVDFDRNAHFPLLEDKLEARHIMTASPVTVKKDTPLYEVVNHFLSNRFRAIPVVNEKGISIGIITPYDILMELMEEFEMEKLE